MLFICKKKNRSEDRVLCLLRVPARPEGGRRVRDTSPGPPGTVPAGSFSCSSGTSPLFLSVSARTARRYRSGIREGRYFVRSFRSSTTSDSMFAP